ncbi:MAG: DUF4013 domain-containing protein [Fimbriiglobus sp.]
MNYMKAYTFLWNGPRGTSNILWGSLAIFSNSFVPLLGYFVWIGYMSEVVRDLERDPELNDHPDFDPNRFSDYLSSGVWPVLTGMLIAIIAIPLLMIIYALGGLVWFFTQEPFAGIGVVLLLAFPMQIVLTLLTWPILLHVQIRKQLEFWEALRFARSMFSKIWGQMLTTFFIYMIFAVVISILGMLLCCVGYYPAMVILLGAQEHLLLQLYRLYLQEGGDPIEPPEVEEDEEPRRRRR